MPVARTILMIEILASSWEKSPLKEKNLAEHTADCTVCAYEKNEWRQYRRPVLRRPSKKGAENFSIAHLEEIVVRSLLHDKTIPVVIKELVEHSAKYKRGFEKKRGGMAMSAYDDD